MSRPSSSSSSPSYSSSSSSSSHHASSSRTSSLLIDSYSPLTSPGSYSLTDVNSSHSGTNSHHTKSSPSRVSHPSVSLSLLSTILQLFGLLRRSSNGNFANEFDSGIGQVQRGGDLIEVMHYLDSEIFTRRGTLSALAPSTDEEADRCDTPNHRFESLKQGVVTFMRNVLETNINIDHIDVDECATGSVDNDDGSTTDHVQKLMELLLLTAIHSQRKEEVIDAIMVMTKNRR